VNLSRRQLLALLGGMLLTKGCARGRPVAKSDSWGREIERALAQTSGPGMACAIVGPGRARWSKGLGLADLEHQRPMLADTLINVASVSKTVTATAAMQLWEQNRFGLQDDVGKHLPFLLRNPYFPQVPITFEQLLTHRSSIKDNWPAYDRTYVCGDSPVALSEWLSGYFTPGGAYWGEANWHQWPPGTVNPPAEPRCYSNVGFGVLGYLVELLSQRPFSEFCKDRIFRPLGMRQTDWFLREIDVARHATPYVRASDQMPARDAGLFRTASAIDVKSLPRGTLVPLCLYGYADYPDGTLRTSANELARFVAAYLAQGRDDGGVLLKPETLRVMFSGEHYGRHLCWETRKLPDGRSIILHGGRDPGVTAFAAFEPATRTGVVCVRNFEVNQEENYRLIVRLLDTGQRIG
jgi:CubicO group peptidase (beta-lactamase class C family)